MGHVCPMTWWVTNRQSCSETPAERPARHAGERVSYLVLLAVFGPGVTGVLST